VVPDSLSGFLAVTAAPAVVDAAPAPVETMRRHASRALALGGAASVAVAAAGFAVAGSAYGRFPEAEDRPSAEALESLNHGGIAAGGAFAAIGGGLVLGAVIKGEW
jgi:hypothetical protein